MASQAAPAPFNPPTHILNADGLGPFLRLQRNLECREIPMMRCRSTSDQLLTPIVQEAVGWMNNLETAFQASFTAASRPTRVGELKRKTNALFGNRIQPNEWVVGIPRTIAGSAGAVTVAERVVPRQRVGYALQLPPGDAVDEVWVARRSVHEDRVAPWTACWADFERSFRGLQHLLTEYSITKSLKAFNRVVSWDNTPHLEVQTHDNFHEASRQRQRRWGVDGRKPTNLRPSSAAGSSDHERTPNKARQLRRCRTFPQSARRQRCPYRMAHGHGDGPKFLQG
ncbi:hypothetical protein B0T22DRAFT_53379 [Podospora appendiculata]|uniref:Uncharacterized protein n=1 Tax=Podospora appendiculata TaxID=314037 RepID=A0AAE1CGL3_9PEZI|nr:hypothetical protein B0T22DRAFT_53379 [Podospora appendiculata]